MMQWTVLENFSVEFEALKETITPPDMIAAKITIPTTLFLGYFLLHCHGVIGKRNTPLNYVLRPMEAVPAVSPDFLTNQAYSADHGSVKGGLIARLSFDHPLYRNDIAQVYLLVAKGLSGMNYLATIT